MYHEASKSLLAQYGEDLIIVKRSKDGASTAATTELGAMDFGAEFGHISTSEANTSAYGLWRQRLPWPIAPSKWSKK